MIESWLEALRSLPVYVLNLETRPDRWRAMTAWLGDWPGGVTRVVGVPADAARPAEVAAFAAVLPEPADKPFAAGKLGCLRGCQRMISQALEDGVEAALLVQDDVIWRPPPFSVGAPPADAGLWLLGGHGIGRDRGEEPGWRSVKRWIGLNAVAVWQRAVMHDLLAAWSNEVNCADRLWWTVLAKWNAAAARPSMFPQAAGWSDIEGRRREERS